MAIDLYSSCPCGSGKKFKWCCHPIHAELERAFAQDEAGQHEGAIKTMDEIIANHPDNAEVLGRKAQLLFNQGKTEPAEETLQKALDLNPNYAFGYMLRGMFREAEGEIPGALLLFRKALELYDPTAVLLLAQLHSMVAECELKLNRPVAARASLQKAVNLVPNHEGLRQNMQQVFGDQSQLPFCARREYRFIGLPADAPTERKARWDQIMKSAEAAKFADAAKMFEELTAGDPLDTSAWYDLALTKAWVGDNKCALLALEKYIEIEPNEDYAEGAAALAEVLRCGHDMIDQANYIEHSVHFLARDFPQVVNFMQNWAREGKLLIMQASEPNNPVPVLGGMIIESKPILTASLGTQPQSLGAYFVLIANRIRLWHTNWDTLKLVIDDVKTKLGPAISEVQTDKVPANFNDLLAEAVIILPSDSAGEVLQSKAMERVQHFFEEVWPQRPLRSLNLIPPVDAAGHAVLRKKLRGAVRFLQDCASMQQSKGYDFDRLRRKLSLMPDGAATTPKGETSTGDITAMGPAELAALAVSSLNAAQLDTAYRTALKADAKDLAGKFAEAIVAQPKDAERPDRFPYFNHLIQLALGEGDANKAMQRVDEGEKADCEGNEGRRRNDYELLRARSHIRRGETKEAQDVFDRLISRMPSEMKYHGAATEAMLSARQGAGALRFAEGGLKAAREKNDRDSEQYFLELVGAAKKMAGG